MLEILDDLLGYVKQAQDQREILIRQGTQAYFQRQRIIELLEQIAPNKNRVIGLIGSHSMPVIRQENLMARIVMLKKSAISNHPRRAFRMGDAAPAAFGMIDNQDSTVTVSGINSDTPPVISDLSAVATLGTPVSSDPTMVTADAPQGMTFMEHALAVGSPSVAVTATWNDGSLGPFEYTDNLTITAPPPPPQGPVTGLVVTHGAPTVRPAVPAGGAGPAPGAQRANPFSTG